MIERIGNTDLLREYHLSNLYLSNIFVKAEFQNPGKSSKDRPALYMIRDAEKRGLLHPGFTVVDASSGNTATGLAMLCNELGYECHFFLSKSASDEKIDCLTQLGAQITVCCTSGGPDDPDSTINRAIQWCSENPQSYFCNQYFNQANQLSHFETTGPEIWEQTDGQITHFISGIGTGGTISGVGKFLKQMDPTITVIGVDSVGSILHDYFYKGTFEVDHNQKCDIEGIGRKFIPGALDISCIDEVIQVSRNEAVQSAYEYIRNSSILPGFSSAAVLAALQKIAPGLRESDRIVLLFADHGSKYQSKLYNEDWLTEHNFCFKSNQVQALLVP
jgi:cystathionine beta-synthase